MTSETQLTLGQRLAAVLDHLGIEQTHIGASGNPPLDALDLLQEQPQRAASITFLTAPMADVAGFEALADRICCMVCELSLAAQQAALDTLRTWSGVTLQDYPAAYDPAPWTDLVADHTSLVVETIRSHAAGHPADASNTATGQGEIAGILYEASGSGPPLLLFPVGLSPTQWTAAMPELEKHFTTIRLGGPYLGMAATLERRATTGTYMTEVRAMWDMLEIAPGDRVLEVGTGQGTLTRDLATRVEGLQEIVGVDVNDYMLGEARNFASKVSPKSPLRYESGNAESLPFEDASFDVAFSVTVFEECDADKAIAELHRVLKPGGRGGVITRSRDLPWVWNVAGSEALRAGVNVADPSAPVGAGGIVDASLYERFGRSFSDVRPRVLWSTSPNPLPSFVARAKARLDGSLSREFDAAVSAAMKAGTFFAATPYHCVVGTKR